MVTSIAISPDGKLLASAGNDATVRLWDPETGTELGEPILNSSLPESIAFGPDGKVLAIGRYDGAIWLLGVPGEGK